MARRCPCGRRSDHPVIPEGCNPGLLPCDTACERRQRWEQLASAFDIPEPDRHRPVAERTRVVAHSPELLFYAWHNLRWVEDVRLPCHSCLLSSRVWHVRSEAGPSADIRGQPP